MFDNKHMLHLWKRHPCALAVHILLAQALHNPDKLQPCKGLCAITNDTCICVSNSLDQF